MGSAGVKMTCRICWGGRSLVKMFLVRCYNINGLRLSEENRHEESLESGTSKRLQKKSKQNRAGCCGARTLLVERLECLDGRR